MDGIAFPNISPIAFDIFGIAVRWYSLAYLAGFLLGWYYILYLIKKLELTSPTKQQIDDFLAIAVLGVILGGRLGYVFFYQPSYYFSNPIEIFQVWQGGMAFHGGTLGVIVAMFAYAHFKKFSFWRLSDLIAATVPIGLFFGRLANFANGELWGRKTDLSWGIRFPEGGYVPRHPSQLYEAFLEGLVLFIILHFALKRFHHIKGLTACVFLIGYGSFRFIVEYFREPDPAYGLIMGLFSMGQMLSLPMIIVGMAVAIYRVKKSS